MQCGKKRKLPAPFGQGAAGWLAQDHKFYCPACAAPIRRSAGTTHLYRFHPVTGQDVNSYDDLVPGDRAEALRDAEARKKEGCDFYWHRLSNDHDFGRVEFHNFKFAFELTGWTVVEHKEFIPEIK